MSSLQPPPAGCPGCRGPIVGFALKNPPGKAGETHFWRCDRKSRDRDGNFPPGPPATADCPGYKPCAPFDFEDGRRSRKFYAPDPIVNDWNGPLEEEDGNFWADAEHFITPEPVWTPAAAPAVVTERTSTGGTRFQLQGPVVPPPQAEPGFGSKLRRTQNFSIPAETSTDQLKNMLIELGVNVRDLRTKVDSLSSFLQAVASS